MSNRPVRVFTFNEANELVPKISELTESVIHELDVIRQRNAPEAEPAKTGIPDALLKDVEEALQAWSERIVELGGNPKGYFTVDFQSVDPELQYCWNYGEDSIGYVHKVWENFSHRRPITESIDAAGDHLKWVN